MSSEPQTSYVRAICSYQYDYKGQEVCMLKDEVFLLINKSSQDWWQVIRDGEKRAFFAPKKYLETVDVSVEVMKSSLRKKKIHQRHLQHQQRFLEETRNQLKTRDLLLDSDTIPETNLLNNSINDSSFLQNTSYESCSIPVLDANKNEAAIEKDDLVFNSPMPSLGKSCSSISEEEEILTVNSISCSSMNDTSTSSLSKRNSLPFTNEKLSISSDFETSSSTRTSISSLNNISRGSIESFTRVAMNQKMVGKAASFDVLQSEDSSDPLTLRMRAEKAASSETIDQSCKRRKEFLFQSDQLTHRNRSNSVDLRRFTNNLDLSESEKIISLEKSRKCRITRDPMNRRRSWALNDSHSLNSYYKQKFPFNEHDTSAILDVPPKLPPKLKVSSKSLLSKSSDNIQEMFELIDSNSEVKKQYLFGESIDVKKEQHPFGNQDRKPVIFPRKILPPQVPIIVNDPAKNCELSPIQFDKHLVKESNIDKHIQKHKTNEESSVVDSHVGEKVSVKIYRLNSKENDNNANKVSNLVDKLMSKPADKETIIEIDKKLSKEENKELVEQQGKDESLEINKHVIKETNNIVVGKVAEVSLSKNPELKLTLQLSTFAPITKKVEPIGVNIEGLIETMENKVKDAKGKSFIMSPPSPVEAARRKMFDDWGEYFDRDSGRPYYYNSKTHDKRWKPPRRSVCSPSILEQNSPPIFVKELQSNLKAVQISSPIFHSSPTSGSIRSYRDRSFTDTSSRNCSPMPTSSPKMSTGNKERVGPITQSPKVSKSIFSSISSSISFMKPSTSTPPLVPPSSSKPQICGLSSSCPTSPVVCDNTSPSFASSLESGQNISLLTALERFYVPRGWTRKYDALSQQIYFRSLVTGEKWNPAVDKSGTVYVYSPNTGGSKWTLQEYDNLPSTPTALALSSSDIDGKSMEPLKKDILNWRFNLKEGKKVKKSWSKSYVNYFPNAKKTRLGKSYGYLTFTKKLNDFKRYDIFDLVPQCHIDSNLKKPNTICLHNGDESEILLQAETPTVVSEWVKAFIEKDKVQEKILTSDKEKRSFKEKSSVKKQDSDVTKGIKESLMLFFKRRIQQETLAKKGIYKDTIFGSTISDICQKEQLNIPMIVMQCIRNIEKNEVNFKVDGLYRISGNASKIQKIRIEIAQNRYPILEDEKDVHNLTGALKLFFRELKEPLIPFANYQSFINATCSEFLKNRARSEALRQTVKKLPLCNRETLKLLLRHLLKINEYEQDNRMSVMNLAIVFGPCLLWPETTSCYDLMTDAMLHNRVVEALLSDFEEVFKCSR